jgi:hypothetical protein
MRLRRRASQFLQRRRRVADRVHESVPMSAAMSSNALDFFADHRISLFLNTRNTVLELTSQSGCHVQMAKPIEIDGKSSSSVRHSNSRWVTSRVGSRIREPTMLSASVAQANELLLELVDLQHQEVLYWYGRCRSSRRDDNASDTASSTLSLRVLVVFRPMNSLIE